MFNLQPCSRRRKQSYVTRTTQHQQHNIAHIHSAQIYRWCSRCTMSRDARQSCGEVQERETQNLLCSRAPMVLISAAAWKQKALRSVAGLSLPSIASLSLRSGVVSMCRVCGVDPVIQYAHSWGYNLALFGVELPHSEAPEAKSACSRAPLVLKTSLCSAAAYQKKCTPTAACRWRVLAVLCGKCVSGRVVSV